MKNSKLFTSIMVIVLFGCVVFYFVQKGIHDKGLRESAWAREEIENDTFIPGTRVGGEDSSYTITNNHIYSYDRLVENADVSSFAYIGHQGFDYGKDVHDVYIGESILEGADPKTFQLFNIIGSYYSKDKNHVFFYQTIVPEADPKTFSHIVVLGGAKNIIIYAQDKDKVFYHGGWGQEEPSIIEGADPKTFQVLGEETYLGGYSKDETHVFWGDKIMPHVDVKTFVALGKKDRQNSYGKDRYHVYIRDKIMENVDPTKFVVPEHN